jgi:hypothetical protein
MTKQEAKKHLGVNRSSSGSSRPCCEICKVSGITFEATRINADAKNNLGKMSQMRAFVLNHIIAKH